MSQKFMSPKLWFSWLGSLSLVGSSLILPSTPTLANTSNVFVIPDSSEPTVSTPTVKLAAPKILTKDDVQNIDSVSHTRKVTGRREPL